MVGHVERGMELGTKAGDDRGQGHVVKQVILVVLSRRYGGRRMYRFAIWKKIPVRLL